MGTDTAASSFVRKKDEGWIEVYRLSESRILNRLALAQGSSNKRLSLTNACALSSNPLLSETPSCFHKHSLRTQVCL